MSTLPFQCNIAHMPVRIAIIFCLLISGATVPSALSLSAQQNRPIPPADAVEAHVGRGYEHVQNSQFQEAAQEFQAALAQDPHLVRVRYQLAVCYFALQQYKESRQEFERLRRETAADPGVIYYLARLDILEENHDSAVSLLEGVVSDPPFPDTAYYLGAAYLKIGKLEAAEKWLKRAAEQAPRDFRVPDRLARLYMKAGRRSEAEQQFTLSTSLRQHYNEGSRQGINCVQDLTTRPLEEARVTCRKLFNPTDPDKLTTLGMIYGKHGYYTDSLEPFEQAARLDPDSFEIQHNLGLSYFRLKRYAQARAPLEKAVALRPDFFGSNALLGASLFALKEDEPAYRVLDHAHQLNPGDTDTAGLLYKVAVLLAQKSFSKKNYAECLDYLKKAAQLRPEDAAIHRRLADLHGLLGQRTEAEREDHEADRLSGVFP
jgi:tetratricopeptide (TPR) repeat protein